MKKYPIKPFTVSINTYNKACIPIQNDNFKRFPSLYPSQIQ